MTLLIAVCEVALTNKPQICNVYIAVTRAIIVFETYTNVVEAESNACDVNALSNQHRHALQHDSEN